jgi:hypothetical protein
LNAGLKITEEAFKGFLVVVVLFPTGEIAGMTASSDLGSPRGSGLLVRSALLRSAL